MTCISSSLLKTSIEESTFSRLTRRERLIEGYENLKEYISKFYKEPFGPCWQIVASLLRIE
jgi:hypothetical protein